MKSLALLIFLASCAPGCLTPSTSHTCPNLTDLVIADASESAR